MTDARARLLRVALGFPNGGAEEAGALVEHGYSASVLTQRPTQPVH
jgi:hypothetical protein